MMPKIEGYESHAEEYEQWFNEHPAIYQAEIKAIQQLLPLGKGIEIGAGSGLFMAPLGTDTGIEPSAAMRQIAQQRGLTLINGVAEALPIKEAIYDYALFITSTCFLDDPVLAYQEAARVTKPKGTIIIAFLEKNSHLGQTYQIHKDKSPFYCDATFYSFEEITSMLEQAGFENFKSVQTVLDPSHPQPATTTLPGHDQGAFIVVRAEKKESL